MGELAVLRTSKLALEEGLISEEDFHMVKMAFLKAQQFRAFAEAGFIREEDYVQARESFLHALDFRGGSAAQPQAGISRPLAPAAPPPPPPPPPPASASIPAGPKANSQIGLQAQTGPPAGTTSSSSPAAPPPVSPRVASEQRPQAAQGSSASMLPGTVPLPANLSQLARLGMAAGKKSMSGIGVNDQCINVFVHIKTKSTFKWVTYRIDDSGLEVIVDQVGAPNSTYPQFLAVLPQGQCRYAVFDYAYTNADTGQTINKLVFIHWASSGSSIKAKMMYASTKDFFKGFLDGLGAEIQGDSLEELGEADLVERVGAAMTRK